MKEKGRLQENAELISKLTQLRKAVKDSVKRFKNFTQLTDSKKLVDFYYNKFCERKQFEADIIQLLKVCNERTNSGGTVSGAFSRLDTKVQILFGRDADDISLTKATYHEESLLNVYQLAMAKPELLHEDMLKTLQQHAQQIEDDIQRLKTFSY